MSSLMEKYQRHKLPEDDKLDGIQSVVPIKNKKKKKSLKHDISHDDNYSDDVELPSGTSAKKCKRKRDNLNIETGTETEDRSELNKKKKRKKTKQTEERVDEVPVTRQHKKKRNKGTKSENGLIVSDVNIDDRSADSETTGSKGNENNKRERSDKVQDKKKAKLKKKHKKKKHHKGEEDSQNEAKTTDVKAIEYLKLWKRDKTKWSFQKVRQVWLLQNVYHSEKVCDGDFSILLEYLEGLQGRSRSLTIDKAQKVISAGEDTINTETEPSVKVNGDKMERARQILQILS